VTKNVTLTKWGFHAGYLERKDTKTEGTRKKRGEAESASFEEETLGAGERPCVTDLKKSP